MAKPPKREIKAPVRTRVNTKALIILGSVILLVLLSIIPIRMLQERRLKRSALSQATASAKSGDNGQAIRLLTTYLRTWPTDIEALSLQGRLMAEMAPTNGDYLSAASVNDMLLRAEPNGPHALDARRRLIDMYIKYSDGVLTRMTRMRTNDAQAAELRYRTAETLARALVNQVPNEAESHRLLALALDGESRTGDEKAREEAVREFEKALSLDPTDVASAQRLALIHLDKRKDPAAAQSVMDTLLRAKPDGIDVRLARYAVAMAQKASALAQIAPGLAQKAIELAQKKDDEANAEIAAAVALDPKSVIVRYVAAQTALQRKDNVAARAHLDAIPEEQADSLPARTLRGHIDYADSHPDMAVDQWRLGLSAVGGSDADLTFQLAYVLLQLNRIEEAKPLKEQYFRLEPDDGAPKSRLLRGAFEEKSGRPSRAIVELELARDRIEDSYWNSELNLILGRCYASNGDDSRAVAAFRRAATIRPESINPYLSIASLIQNQNLDGAIAEMERGIATTVPDPTAYAELARMNINRQSALPENQRDWTRAEDLLAKAEKLAPNLPRVINTRADLLAASNRLNEAVDRLTKATEGPSRGNAEVWQTLVVGLVRQNQTEKAFQVLDRAMAPDAVGNNSDMRMLRARLLVQTGHAQAAKDLLAQTPEGTPTYERAKVARNRGEILRQLGDRKGARLAFAEWARLAPDDPVPGLILVEMGQTGDAEATRLGLEALRNLGGDDEPYGLSARALALLGEPKPGEKTPEADLNKADDLIAKLQFIAPELPLGHLLRGILLERRLRDPEAIDEYKKALRSNTQVAALSRIVALYTKLKRYDELAELRKSMGTTLVDQLSAAESLKLGDKERAEQLASQLVEGQPDSLQFRSAQAQLLRELGRPLEAQETLRELTTRQPNQPGPWLALLLFQVGQKDQAGARATIDRATKLFKGDRPDLLIARCRWLVGDTDEAAKLYDAILAKNGNDVDSLKSVAEFHEAQNRPDKTEEILRRAIKLDPTAPWAARWLAMLISAKGPDKWAEAWALIAPGAPGAGIAPEDRLILATVLGRAPEAARRAEAMPTLITLAQDLPDTDPISIEARVRLGQTYIQMNRLEDSVRIILPSADNATVPNAAALAIAVEGLSKTNKPAEAQIRLDRLLAIEPKTPRSIAARAWVARASGKADEGAAAVEAYLPELEKLPAGEGMTLAFLNLLNEFDRPEVTERVARKVAALWPRDAWILAKFLVSRDRIPEALDFCRIASDAGSVRESVEVAATSLDRHSKDAAIVERVASLVEAAHAKSPKDTIIANCLASVRHMQGRYDEELALYQESLDADSSNPSFLNNLAWTLSEAKGKYEEGLKQVDEAIRRIGRIGPLLDTRGVILTRLKRNDEAIKDLEESAKLSPSPVTSYHLARVYLQAGREADHHRARDAAKEAGLNPEKLDPSDRSDLSTVMKP